MQAAEKAADASGHPKHSYDQLMENAGRAVAMAVKTRLDVSGRQILVLVGPGNNGGDGLVAARHLAQMGGLVTVYIWRREVGPTDKNWDLLAGTNIQTLFSEYDAEFTQLRLLLKTADVIIDALLGTGVSRPIAGGLAELLDITRQMVVAQRLQNDKTLVEPSRPVIEIGLAPLVVAVDLPSGLNSDTGQVDPYTLPADLSVTFGAVKYGHILMPGPEVVGRLLIDDIGLKPEHFPAEVTLEMATATMAAEFLPPRPISAHKGTFGTALLVAGSINYTGAAILAGQAALRSGTGLVTLATPQTIYPILAAHLIEVTYLPLPDVDGAFGPEAVPTLRKKFSEVSAILIGPGLSQAGLVDAVLPELLVEPDSLPPLIVDADALNILARQTEWWRMLPANSILTPHPGEMARLTGTTIDEV